MKNIFFLIFLSLNFTKAFATLPDFETCLLMVKNYPDNTFFHYNLGKHFEKSENFTEALREYRICQKLNPKPYYESAVSRVSNRINLKKNIQSLSLRKTRIQQKSPLQKKADFFYKNKDYSEAIKLYQKLLVLKPSGYLFKKLSKSYLYNHQAAEAKKVLSVGKDFLSDSDPFLQELKGDIEFHLANYQSALSWYQKSLNAKKRKTRLFQKIAKVYRFQKNYMQARAFIQKSLSSDKNFYNFYEAAKIEEKMEQWTSAIGYYQKAKIFEKKEFQSKLLKQKIASCRFQESLKLYQDGKAKSASEKLEALLQDQSLSPSLTEKAKFWKKQADFRAGFNKFFHHKKH